MTVTGHHHHHHNQLRLPKLGNLLGHQHLPHLGSVVHHITGKEALIGGVILVAACLALRRLRNPAEPRPPSNNLGLLAVAAAGVGATWLLVTHQHHVATVAQHAAPRIVHPTPSPSPPVVHPAVPAVHAAASHPLLSGGQIVLIIVVAAVLILGLNSIFRFGRHGSEG